MAEGIKETFLERMTNGYNQGKYNVEDVEREIGRLVERDIKSHQQLDDGTKVRALELLSIVKPEERPYVALHMHNMMLSGRSAFAPEHARSLAWAAGVWERSLDGLSGDMKAHAALYAKQHVFSCDFKDGFTRPNGERYLDEVAEDTLKKLSIIPEARGYLESRKSPIALDEVTPGVRIFEQQVAADHSIHRDLH